MGEHTLKNAFRDHSQTATSPASQCAREHAYQCIVQAVIPTQLQNGQNGAIQLSRVVCIKCGSVIDPFPELKPVENAPVNTESLSAEGLAEHHRTGKAPVRASNQDWK